MTTTQKTRTLLTCSAALWALGAGAAQAQMNTAIHKFQFGAGRAAPGYTPVLPTTLYTATQGYGLEPGAHVSQGAGSMTSDTPFLFAVALPEGNYTVTVTLGDPKSASDTTLKTQARQLALQDIRTAPGKTVTRAFTVNIRTPQIAGGGQVHLKPREIGPPLFADWDSRLLLEFNGPHPSVESVTAVPDPHAVTVYLLGDSTVTDQPDEPWGSWGQMLPRFFRAGIAVANHAQSGESLRSSLDAHRLDKVLSTIKPGDYLFIQYGHNDQKEHGAGVGAFTTYKADLKHFVDEAKKRGALPVLVTSMNRRRFDAQGKLVPTLGDYPEAVRQAAREEDVPLIDLNAMSKTLFEALGPQGTLKAFVHYPAGSFPGQTVALKDDTHFNSYGAFELARCVVEGIKAAKLTGLTPFLVTDMPPFDPARPDSAAAFHLAISPAASAEKPYGN